MSNRPLHQQPLPEPADGEPCAVIPLRARRTRQTDPGHRAACEEFAAYLGKRLADGRVAECDLELAFGLRLRRVPLEHAMTSLGDPASLEILDEIVDTIESAWSGANRCASSNGPVSQVQALLRQVYRATT